MGGVGKWGCYLPLVQSSSESLYFLNEAYRFARLKYTWAAYGFSSTALIKQKSHFNTYQWENCKVYPRNRQLRMELFAWSTLIGWVDKKTKKMMETPPTQLSITLMNKGLLQQKVRQSNFESNGTDQHPKHSLNKIDSDKYSPVSYLPDENLVLLLWSLSSSPIQSQNVNNVDISSARCTS